MSVPVWVSVNFASLHDIRWRRQHGPHQKRSNQLIFRSTHPLVCGCKVTTALRGWMISFMVQSLVSTHSAGDSSPSIEIKHRSLHPIWNQADLQWCRASVEMGRWRSLKADANSRNHICQYLLTISLWKHMVKQQSGMRHHPLAS